MDQIPKEIIEKELSKIMHPEINFSLVKLSMIKNIEIKENLVSLTLKLPFLAVPIKEDLINSIKESITNINQNLQSKISILQMSEKERRDFVELAREGWKI